MRREFGSDTANENGDSINETFTEVQELDVLIAGSGFSGCKLLYQLRKLGFSVKIAEAGTDLGGIWHWNTYPGARVDSPYPVYSLSMPEVYETWTWAEQYPGYEELQRYFAHVEKQLDLKKDIFFNSTVISAEFDESESKWTISCDNGRKFRACFFIAAIGFAAKRHFPDWKGLDSFEGIIHHSSFWPKDVDVQGKRIAVIGTGATGVQIAQECAKTAGELIVFVRTPNIALPMRQDTLSEEQQAKDRLTYSEMYKHRQTTDGGFIWTTLGIPQSQHSAEEREAVFEEQWRKGGFRFIAQSYNDILKNPIANRHCYDFWARKTRERIHDKEVADILAPLEPPHPFGAKRPSLEQEYYDRFNQPNVHVVSVKKTPIVEIAPKGIVTADGKVYEVDVIALATGFDAVTGGLKDICMTGVGGQKLSDKWEMGTWTYLGMTTSGFPNFFFTYGPQAPTAFSNGPACLEPQCDWIVQLLGEMRREGLKRIDAEKDAEEKWRELVNSQSEKTLRHNTKSWYMGTNIAGKPKEALNYGGGIPLYTKTLAEVLENNYKGFIIK